MATFSGRWNGNIFPYKTNNYEKPSTFAARAP
jgi:hypothetical protein